MHAPSLRTERLVAWPLSPDDIDEVAALWADRTVMAHTDVGVLDRPHSLDRLRADADHWARHGFGPWAFRRTTTGALVGEGGCRHSPDSGDDTVEFSLVCGRRWWGHGLAVEAGAATLDELWHTSEVSRVWAFIDPDHAAGRALVARLGFHRVGERVRGGITREAWVLERPV